MFTVECPGCKASYQVDERRVPATGLRMRCPKCSTAFVVEKPNSLSTGDAAAPSADLPANVAPRVDDPVVAAKGPPPAPGRPPPPARSPVAGAPLAGKAPAAPLASKLQSPGLLVADPGRLATATDASKQSREQTVEQPDLPARVAKPLVPVGPRPIPPARRATPGTTDDLLPEPAKRPDSPRDANRASTRETTPGIRKPAALEPPIASVDIEVDLPGLASGVAGSGVRKDVPVDQLEPDQPVTSRGGKFSDLPEIQQNYLPAATLESDLPAAFGAKRTRAATQPSASTPTEVGPPIGDRDLPGVVGLGGRERLLPKVKEHAQNKVTWGNSGKTSKGAGAAVALPATTSSPPALDDDFEFNLPSPMQAQKGFPEFELGENSGDRRRGTQPGGFELPNLSVGLPATSRGNVGLPSVPGRDERLSKPTLAGTGSSSPPVWPAAGERAHMVESGMGEVDLGLDFDLDSGRDFNSGRPGLAGSSSSPPNLFEAPVGTVSPTLGQRASSRAGVDFGVAVPDMELPISGSGFPPKRPATSSMPPASAPAGGTAYGEVSLEAPEQELLVETEGDSGRRSLSGETLEFGGIPQALPGTNTSAERIADLADEPVVQRTATSPSKVSVHARSAKARSARPRVFGLAVLALAVLGGGALTLLPDVGPFGAYFLGDQIRRKDNDALLQRHVSEGQKVFLADDFSAVAKVLGVLDASVRDHERLRALKAYAAFFAYAIELRHGTQPQNRARAKVILDELGDKYDLKYLGLAGAARAAVEGNLAKARRAISAEISRDPRNVDAQVMSAEICMLERRFNDALQAWQLAGKLEPSARSAFGLARVYFALGQYDEASSDAEQAISRNPNHVGARLLLARVALVRQGDLELAQKRITDALALPAQQSVADFVLGKVLTGDLQLIRSRISLAEAAYQEALDKNPRSAAALRGLGETLYRAGRYSESLARFEAGLQADPDDVMVAVGVAKAQLALERVRDAGAVLMRLRQAYPKHYSVNYWYAKAEEAAGNREEAEKGYAAAIEVGGTDPIVVDAYVSMALLKNQQGRREEAQKVLATAQEKLPRMPKIHEAIGQLALAEGRYSGAVEQFKLALSLDPNDLGIKFRLGVALRKNRDFEAAAKVFDEVTAIDRDYPGLALERGQLYEASGQTEEALRAFESALAKAPTDPDLMLRVGCGKVAAGRSQQAEQLLKKVLEQRPTSAETHHCLGRAQLLEGSNLAMALRTLERAVELDPHRAEYHLYVGWAANEAGRVALAEQALKKALELDQGLGDAYWQRGILRYRQGAVKDAVTDLTRALELRPGRYEAHAALADAYFDLGFEQKALEQWRQATVAQPDNATWRYRYGKLLQAVHRDAEAKVELETALELAAKLAVVPRWAWEAHHLLARALGSHPSAVKHWQSFLELAPRDNVYREEAKQALVKLGQAWDRD